MTDYEKIKREFDLSGIASCQKQLGELSAALSRLFPNGLPAGTLADYICPVGGIYISTLPQSPATLYGGSWERIEDRFLLCAGQTFVPGSVGGEAQTTLEMTHIPAHRHQMSFLPAEGEVTEVATWSHGLLHSATAALPSDRQSYPYTYGTSYTGGVWDAYHNGSTAAHNNMPPYLAVYVWRRTA